MAMITVNILHSGIEAFVDISSEIYWRRRIQGNNMRP